MPELGPDGAAMGMRSLNCLFPTRQGLFAVKHWHLGVIARSLTIDGGALSDDEA